jgi:hypothetical protein
MTGINIKNISSASTTLAMAWSGGSRAMKRVRLPVPVEAANILIPFYGVVNFSSAKVLARRCGSKSTASESSEPMKVSSTSAVRVQLLGLPNCSCDSIGRRAHGAIIPELEND